MTINAQTGISDVQLGDGINLVFPFEFKVSGSDEIEVYVDGVLLAASEYSVDLSNDWTGDVTFDEAPADGAEIVLVANPDFAQSSTHLRQGPFYPDVVEDDLDKAALRDIFLKRETDRSFKLPLLNPTSEAGSFPVVLPDGSAGWSQGTGADAGLRGDLAALLGANLLAVTHAQRDNYLNGSIGKHVTNTVHAGDAPFNATGLGVADDTAALAAAFAYCVPRKRTLVMEGRYRISNTLLATILGTGAVNLHFNGDVEIIVDAGATPFDHVIYWEGAAAPNCQFTGGSLSIDGNNKVANGITIRHNAATRGGSVVNNARISISNIFDSDAARTGGNFAFLIFGDFDFIMSMPVKINGVQRTNPAGATGGFSVSGFSGQVIIHAPDISNVISPSVADTDADGFLAFGKPASAGSFKSRLGNLLVIGGVLSDNRGRHIKVQCSTSVLTDVTFLRQFVVTIANGHDVDFQFGNGKLIRSKHIYKKNGATNPLGASFFPVAFQNILDDAEMTSLAQDCEVVTEVAVLAYVAPINNATAKKATYVVDGCKFTPAGGLATSVLTNGIVQFRGDLLVGKAAETDIIVKNCTGQLSCGVFGYDSLAADTQLTQLRLVSESNKADKTGGLGYSRVMSYLSGAVLTGLRSWKFKDNPGFTALIGPVAGSNFVFDFYNLEPGSVFAVDTDGVTATRAPAWDASGGQTAHIEVLEQWTDPELKAIRVTQKVGATVTSWFTELGGASWGTI